MSPNATDVLSLTTELRTALKATILTPESDGYAQSILRWSDAIINQPAIIVFAESASDVSTTILACLKYNVPFAVSGGRHTTSDGSSSYGGVVIDLRRMKKVTVDTETKIVTVEGGCRWKDVDDALDGHALALVEGIVNDTGVGGITLGGGYGWLAPRHGLIIDSLIAVKMVLADGRTVVASEQEDADLFWAVRGAGQCFGVAVEFDFLAHEHQDPVTAGLLGFPISQINAVFDFANNLVETTDGNSAMVIQLSVYPFSQPQVGIMAIIFHNGPSMAAKEVFRPLFDLNPLLNTVTQQSYASANGMLVPAAIRGGRNVSKGAAYTTPLRPAFVNDVVIPELRRLHAGIPGSERSILEFEFYKPDKWCEVSVTATAHGHRGRAQNVMIGLYWNNVDDDVRVRKWSVDIAKMFLVERLEYGSPSSTASPITEYGNYDHLSAHPRDIYGVNFERLVELKRRYDPGNVFDKWFSLM
ncbi:hypothetical protein BJY04DRAFT_216357 [Aspergillus karnatakaensis]|uniref:FAD-binding oxidoreductase n=1 Tax=Aspergillus karnatakaensis TaxID=1810916 RepID=UPI003CCD8CE8